MESSYHIPVLRDVAVGMLEGIPDGPIVDGTCGGGGHTEALLQRMGSDRCIIGVDRDPEAIDATRKRVGADSRSILVQGNFGDLRCAVTRAGIDGDHCVSGILLDLGVSSRQLDWGPRGFAFRYPDAQLDMRMDQCGDTVTARSLVRDTDTETLAKILRDYGDVPKSRRIAGALKEAEADAELETTGDLAELVARFIPYRPRRRQQIHPATTVFQALRIAVNGEMDALERALKVAPDLLKPGGRMVVISYHAAEDRRVKNAFRVGQRGPERKANLPLVEPFRPYWRVLTRKPTVPSETELTVNPRSRSAKLRAVERAAFDVEVLR
jgi:16S rRNA (cytosine1402-N4)-methyltransferase